MIVIALAGLALANGRVNLPQDVTKTGPPPKLIFVPTVRVKFSPGVVVNVTTTKLPGYAAGWLGLANFNLGYLNSVNDDLRSQDWKESMSEKELLNFLGIGEVNDDTSNIHRKFVINISGQVVKERLTENPKLRLNNASLKLSTGYETFVVDQVWKSSEITIELPQKPSSTLREKLVASGNIRMLNEKSFVVSFSEAVPVRYSLLAVRAERVGLDGKTEFEISGVTKPPEVKSTRVPLNLPKACTQHQDYSVSSMTIQKVFDKITQQTKEAGLKWQCFDWPGDGFAVILPAETIDEKGKRLPGPNGFVADPPSFRDGGITGIFDGIYRSLQKVAGGSETFYRVIAMVYSDKPFEGSNINPSIDLIHEQSYSDKLPRDVKADAVLKDSSLTVLIYHFKKIRQEPLQFLPGNQSISFESHMSGAGFRSFSL